MYLKDITPEVFNQILESLYQMGIGKTLEKFKIPVQTFYDYLHKNPLADERYSRAQVGRSEILAGEIVDIADEDPDANRARNRIGARQWYASKIQPRKYGERTTLELDVKIPVASILTEARSRLPKPIEVIESTPLLPNNKDEDTDIFS